MWMKTQTFVCVCVRERLSNLWKLETSLNSSGECFEFFCDVTDNKTTSDWLLSGCSSHPSPLYCVDDELLVQLIIN